MVDPFRKQRNLDFRRAGIVFMELIRVNYLLLFLFLHKYNASLYLIAISRVSGRSVPKTQQMVILHFGILTYNFLVVNIQF